jgi:molybdopterin molybdotransferase
VGERIFPQQIAVLAAVGCTRPRVSRRPRVGVLATGDELVEPDRVPGPSRIRNTNGPQLLAQARAMGAEAAYHGVAKDDAESLREAIARAAAASDLILVSGGVSMGELDLVPDALRAAGFDLLFEKVAVKPGRPTVFGVSETGACFGLPGNPVSTFILFELLVKPFVFRMQGHECTPPAIRVPLDRPLKRRKADRRAFVPVTLTPGGAAREVECHGSAHVHALAGADAVTTMPPGVAEIPAGRPVPLWLIR